MPLRAVYLLIFTFWTHFASADYCYITSNHFDSFRFILNSDTFDTPKPQQTIRVKTEYPELDTLIILRHGISSPILCNFQPDSTYTFISSCCDAEDIVPMSQWEKLEKWDAWHNKTQGNNQNDVTDWGNFTDSVKTRIYDSIFITIVPLNVNEDTIFAWHATATCFSKFKRLNNAIWDYGLANTCHNWSNIVPFVFFKYPEEYFNISSHPELLNGKENDSFPLEEYPDSLNILAEVSFRIFHYSHVQLHFDAETKVVRLDYY